MNTEEQFTPKYPTAEACIEAASTVNCHDLHDVLDAINELKIGSERKSALLQNVLTIHATGDYCNHEDNHKEIRETYL